LINHTINILGIIYIFLCAFLRFSLDWRFVHGVLPLPVLLAPYSLVDLPLLPLLPMLPSAVSLLRPLPHH
jgi:hypothetical protein